MKTKLPLTAYVTIVTCCFIVQNTFAQLQVNNNFPGSDIWGQVNPATNIQSIGIGDFNGQTPQVWPLSALHINTNSAFMPSSPTFNAGEVFRTDAPSGLTAWRMLRQGNEYGAIYNNNDNHFYIQANDASGELHFNTGGTNTRMTILSGGDVGIGTLSPVEKLDVDGNINVSGDYRIDGVSILKSLTGGNLFVGESAGVSNTVGSNNVFIGQSSGFTNQTGYRNTFVGGFTGSLNFNGDCNSFFGYNSGTKNSSGEVNAFFGYNSGSENTTGSFNAFLGSGAGINNRTGYENTFIGQQAGYSNTTGRYNTFVGAFAIPDSSNLINATAIGAYATVTKNNSLILGSIAGINGADSSVNVGIGTTAPASKLDVRNNIETHAIYALTDYSSNTTGVGIMGESKNATFLNAGVAGYAQDSTSSINIGIVGIASGSLTQNHGVEGIAEFSSTGNNTINYGVRGSAQNSDHENHGGRFKAEGSTGLNVAVYGRTANTGTNYSAGYFDGDLEYTGSLIPPSDSKLKENVADIENALDIISRLQPKDYLFRRADYPHMNLPKGKQYGLIAQEVESVLPELIKETVHPSYQDDSGRVINEQVSYKGINYIGFIPVLIGAVKEQQHVIDSLNNVINNRLTAIESTLQQCCGASQYRMANPNEENSGNTSYQNIELSNLQAVVLEQNVPNPFAENTSISYFVPTEAHSARMIFYDALGRIVKEVDVEKGHGVISVFASNLSAGTYSYTLLVDGNAVETKKMLKSN